LDDDPCDDVSTNASGRRKRKMMEYLKMMESLQKKIANILDSEDDLFSLPLGKKRDIGKLGKSYGVCARETGHWKTMVVAFDCPSHLSPEDKARDILAKVSRIKEGVPFEEEPAKTKEDEVLPKEEFELPDYIKSAIDGLLKPFDKTFDGLLVPDSTSEVTDLRAEVERLKTMPFVTPVTREKKVYEGDGSIPPGEVNWVDAATVFETYIGMSIPMWTWEYDHPHVPIVDDSYVIREEYLRPLLYSITTDQRCWLHGETGSGKTTLIEQVCARMGYPVVRVNFHAHVRDSDLLGKTDLRDGETVWIDGTLPRAMQSPCVFIADEMDHIKSNSAYIMQPILEGNNLRIMEDGDRVVTPHEYFRVIATANTVGQGDETGAYPSAITQSLAVLDRFTVWQKVEYLSEDQRSKYINEAFPSLSDVDKKLIKQYTVEHLEAFHQHKVIQPMSLRSVEAVCQATSTLGGEVRDHIMMCVVNRANQEDRITLMGILDRVCK
jgi:cobaltochelatase CobS